MLLEFLQLPPQTLIFFLQKINDPYLFFVGKNELMMVAAKSVEYIVLHCSATHLNQDYTITRPQSAWVPNIWLSFLYLNTMAVWHSTEFFIGHYLEVPLPWSVSMYLLPSRCPCCDVPNSFMWKSAIPNCCISASETNRKRMKFSSCKMWKLKMLKKMMAV